MIFVDANIPMYLIGAEHPHKRDSVSVMERLASEGERLVTSTEVFQEIMHRYAAIRRKDAIQPAFDVLYALVDEIFPITERDILEAKNLLIAYEVLSARDALHAAHMQLRGIHQIVSFDTGFDLLPRIERLPQ